jgi:hypothetical protein
MLPQHLRYGNTSVYVCYLTIYLKPVRIIANINTMQDEHQSLPNTDRLSVLAASILLAYALLPFIKIPERNLFFEVSGVFFVFKLDFSTVLAIISAGLAASGTDWLLRGHPRLGRQATFQHWLVPSLTALVIGVPLSTLVVGIQWWTVFAFGGLLLVLVLVSEYIAVDPSDIRHGPATIGLTAVSYALFLILTVALAAAESRLYILIPALTGAIFLAVLRTLNLRLTGRWCFAWSLGIAFVIGQVAAALHYWPLSPLRFGLLILGLAYALASTAGSIEEGRSWRVLWIEPAIMLAVLWGLAFGL